MPRVYLHRKSNFFWMARSFSIIIDGKEMSSIANGQRKILNTDPDASELSVKIGKYRAEPVNINTKGETAFVVRQNPISSIITVLTFLLMVAYFIAKFSNFEQYSIFLYLALPFVGVTVFFSLFRRGKMILLEEIDFPVEHSHLASKDDQKGK